MSKLDELNNILWEFVRTGKWKYSESSIQIAAAQASSLGPIAATWFQTLLGESGDPYLQVIKISGARDSGLDLGSAPALLRRNIEQSYSPDATDTVAALYLAVVPGARSPALDILRRPDLCALDLHLLVGSAHFDPDRRARVRRTLFRRNGALNRVGLKLARRFSGLESFLRTKFAEPAKRSRLGGLRRFFTRKPTLIATTGQFDRVSCASMTTIVEQFKALIASAKHTAALTGSIVIVIPNCYEDQLLAALSQHPANFKVVQPSAFRGMVGYINPPTGEGVNPAFARRMLAEIGIQTTGAESIFLVYLELSRDHQHESIKMLNALDRTLVLATQQAPTSEAVRASVATLTRMVHGVEVMAASGEAYLPLSHFLMDVLVASAPTEAERASTMWKIAGVLWETGNKQTAIETFRTGLALASPAEPIMGFLPDGLVTELKKLQLSDGGAAHSAGNGHGRINGRQLVTSHVLSSRSANGS